MKIFDFILPICAIIALIIILQASFSILDVSMNKESGFMLSLFSDFGIGWIVSKLSKIK